MKSRCFLCFRAIGDMLPGFGGGPNEFAVDEDTDVRAEAILRAGEVERGFEVELELDRECV